MGPDADDDTVRLPGRRAAGGSGRPWWAFGLAGVMVAALAGGGGWYALRPAPPGDPAPRSIAPLREPAAAPATALPRPVPAAAVAPPAAVAPAPVAAAPVAQLAAPPVAAAEPQAIVPPATAPSAVAPPAATPAAPTVLAAIVRPPGMDNIPAPYAPPLATEAEILAEAPSQLRVYRFAPQPAILVLHFPTLAEQARALNRAAALLEKNGFPKDRVLSDAELDQRIRASGVSPDTFYYGHDYRAPDLVRFFKLAESAGTALTPEEIRLQQMLARLGWNEGTQAALISLVKRDDAAGVDQAARATILRHELSHGEFFTNPRYAAYAQQFWQETLTARERAQFTTYLTSDGYDPAVPNLFVNEMQAYLMHTTDTRFFKAAAVGMTEARLAALRVIFLTGMPPGWLRDCTTAVPVQPPATTVRSNGPAPVRVPRQRRAQRLGKVRIIRSPAARRPRRADTLSSAVRNSRK